MKRTDKTDIFCFKTRAYTQYWRTNSQPKYETNLVKKICTSRPCCSLKSRLRVRFVSTNVSNFCSSSSCWRPNWSECAFDCFLSWMHKMIFYYYSRESISEVTEQFGVLPTFLSFPTVSLSAITCLATAWPSISASTSFLSKASISWCGGPVSDLST